MCKPFLRWAGGKRRLAPSIVDRILPLLDEGRQYVEPFLGSGAVFFELRKKGWEGVAQLSELNEDLIWLYRCVQDPICLKALFAQLAVWRSDPVLYEVIKACPPSSGLQAAARVYYLNRCGFNGLWRVNQAGQYNVPYGRPEGDARPVCDGVTLLAASKALHMVELSCCDFEAQIAKARHGDVIYCDPPYPGGFTAYTPEGFSEDDQRRLGAALVRQVMMHKARVVVSISDCALSRDIYSNVMWRTEIVTATRSVAAAGDSRGKVKELLISSRGM